MIAIGNGNVVADGEVEPGDCVRVSQAVLTRAILDSMPGARGIDPAERTDALDFLARPDLDGVIAATGMEP